MLRKWLLCILLVLNSACEVSDSVATGSVEIYLKANMSSVTSLKMCVKHVQAMSVAEFPDENDVTSPEIMNVVESLSLDQILNKQQFSAVTDLSLGNYKALYLELDVDCVSQSITLANSNGTFTSVEEFGFLFIGDFFISNSATEILELDFSNVLSSLAGISSNAELASSKFTGTLNQY